MTETEQTELRAVVLSVVSEVVAGLQRHLDQQILELQVDVEAALEKLDSIEIDVKDTRVQLAKLGREQIKDRRRDEAVGKRLSATERRLDQLEKDIRT